MEGQGINMCRYYTAQRVMNWHYSGSLKTPSSHRSCVCIQSFPSGLACLVSPGQTLPTTHNCPFPPMLPNNKRHSVYTPLYYCREHALQSDRDPNLLEGCLAVQGGYGSLKDRRNCRRFAVTSPFLSSCNKGNSKSCHLDSSKQPTSCCWGKRTGEAQRAREKSSKDM